MRKAQQTSTRVASLSGMERETWQVFSQHVFLSYQARRELLEHVAPMYQTASLAKKTLILNDFVKMTGYARKSAIRLLNHPPANTHVIQRPRLPIYGLEVQQALFLAWKAAAHICAKRLVPYLPSLVADLERCGHLQLSEEHKSQLLAMSATTAERLLRTQRKPTQHGLSTTKAGTLLKSQIPIRTFREWDQVQPGFLEADLVAHCGGHVEGGYVYTLTLTDVATGWTECLPLLNRSPETVLAALRHARALLPFPMIGLDTDNGKEFINEVLLAYCEQEQITFTRGRPEQKADQCYVEQKNGAVVRQMVGHARLMGELVAQQLGELYRAVRLYVNCFQPSMKLQEKICEEERVRRIYDDAKTPLQRLILSGVLSEARAQELQEAAQTLDPLRLVQQIDELQRALWRCVGRTTSPSVVRFSPDGCVPLVLAGSEQAAEDPILQGQETAGSQEGLLQPRSTRDPFAGEWPFIVAYVAAHPQCSGGELFQELERRHPGRYAPSHLTALSIGLRQIRARQVEAQRREWPTEVIQAALVGADVSGEPEHLHDHAQDVLQSVEQSEETLPVPSGTEEEASVSQPVPLAPVNPDAPFAPEAEPCQNAAVPVSFQEDPKFNGRDAALLLLEQVGRWFLEEQQARGRSPKTLAWHTLGLKQLQDYFTRRHLYLLSDVTETEVRDWLAFLRAEPSATGSLRTANTVLTAARSVHAFCAWAMRQGYLPRMPFVSGMVHWKKNREREWQHIQVIEPEIFEQLLHACRPPGRKGENEDYATARNRALLWMMREMGLLVSEVCALQMGDVDERFQTLYIQGSGARDRQLPVPENTRRALRAYLMHQRVRMGKPGTQEPLFLSERCKHMTPNLVTQLFHRLSLRAGITEQWITPSMLRDTFAVRYLQAGGNLRALQEHLGLEDAVSVKRYQQCSMRAGLQK